MMKRIVALILVMVMCATAAMAAEWPEGLGPQKPYSGSPEIDFNESFGFMMLWPFNGKTVAPGEDTLSIFLPREDVEVAAGTLGLYTKEDGLVEEIAISAETAVLRPLSEQELDSLMWGGGVAIDIKLAQQLDPNFNYYVQLSEGCFVSPDYPVASPAIDGKKGWAFSTETENYIENLYYCRMVEGQEEPEVVENVQVGDMVKFSIVLGEEGVSAALHCDAGAILPEITYFEESAEATVRFPSSGEVKWGVVFLDADGAGLYSMNYTTNVSQMLLTETEAAE